MRLTALLLAILGPTLASAELHPIHVAPVTGEGHVAGATHGFEVVSYLLDVRAGQSLRYEFSETTNEVYANIWGPNAVQALWVGAARSNGASVLALESGPHQIDVYQPVEAARAGSKASFTLKISVSDPEAPEHPDLAEGQHAEPESVLVEPLSADRPAGLPIAPHPIVAELTTVPFSGDEGGRRLAALEPVPVGIGRPMPRPSLARVTGVSTLLNMREAPSRDTGIVSTLQNGKEVIVYECTASREQHWCNVRSGRDSGWVAAEFLTEAAG